MLQIVAAVPIYPIMGHAKSACGNTLANKARSANKANEGRRHNFIMLN